MHRTDFFYKGITIIVSQERSQGTCNVPHLPTGVGQVARRGGQYMLGLLLARLKGQLERREMKKSDTPTILEKPRGRQRNPTAHKPRRGLKTRRILAEGLL